MQILKPIVMICSLSAASFFLFLFCEPKEEFIYSKEHSEPLVLGPVGTWKFKTNGLIVSEAIDSASLKEILDALSRLPLHTTNLNSIIITDSGSPPERVVYAYDELSNAKRRRIVLKKSENKKWKVYAIVPFAEDSFGPFKSIKDTP
jgi:hypothetical protein